MRLRKVSCVRKSLSLVSVSSTYTYDCVSICKQTYRVSPLLGSPYDSSTSSRTGLRRFHAPDAPRRLLGRAGSDDFITRQRVTVVMRLVWERRYYGLKVYCYQPIAAVEGAMLGVRREGSGVWGSEQGKVQPD